MKISTLLATVLVVAASLPAVAQTELNTRPPASPTPGVYSNPPGVPAPQPTAWRRYRTSSLGIDLGWGGPYGGLGVNYAHLIGAATDFNVGMGIGVGGKIGFGVRQYLSPTKSLSPYLGVNVSRTGRINDVNLTLDEDLPTEEKVNYNMAPSGVLHLRSGLRWQPGRVGLLGTLGYGVRFTNDPITYNTPTGQRPSQRMRDLVNLISPGGLEISLGMSIGLGR